MTDPMQPKPSTLDYSRIMSLTKSASHQWDARDSMLYAFGIGMAENPLDEAELRFVFEKELQAFPTMPVAIALADGPLDYIGIDYRYVLHGEQAVTLHRPFPPNGKVRALGRMIGAWDKGPGKGAVFSQEKVLTLEGEDTPLATTITTSFGRAEGGFGGPTEGQPMPHVVPDRPPDRTIDIPTTRRQALLYRLSGDRNPLHADPETARAAGFERPILHGLCTFAICCRAVMQAFCAMDPARIRHHQVRFSAPVLPGDTLQVSMWQDDDIISFEAHVVERNVTVIRNGMTILQN